MFCLQLAKDSLTQSNIPHGECAICLESFDDCAPFTKTLCYHYFHCHCLAKYACPRARSYCKVTM